MIIQELKTIQKVHGYLPVEELQALSRRLQVPLYRLQSVASFYPHFRLQPPPAIDIKVCNDVACYLRGTADLHEIIRTAVNALSLSNVHITSTSCLGQCDGAPAVAINGQSVRSCQTTMAEVNGKNIVTIEGLERDGSLHPLQQAFVDHGALQCGFCTSGMIMNAYALLQANPKPTRAAIVEEMDSNLCRCGAHQRIIAAIEDAAARKGGGR